MFKNWEMVLYFLTGFFCMVLGIASINAPELDNPVSFVARRNIFYIVELGLLGIVYVRCIKLLDKYDSDYFERTEKLFHAAEVCFVLVAIVTVFAVVEAVPTIIFLPRTALSGGIAGTLVLLAFTALTWVIFSITSSKYHKVIKQKAESDHPPSVKLEDFYAFIHSADETEEPPDVEMPDASSLLEETVPSEEEFQRHMQQIANQNQTSEPKPLKECPFCGALNLNDSEQCSICGAELDK